MSVFDRFASPLRSRDPETRLRAVRKQPSRAPEPLAELARRDPDARVRREAVRRIEAPRVLLELAAEAPAEDTRKLARTRSESLLTRIAADNRDLGESQRALGLLKPLPAVAEVVCRARFEPVRQAALDRLTDSSETAAGREEALARVASRATAPAVRARALGAIRGAAALGQVALGAGARETAQAAARRLEDPDLLLRVAEKATTRSVRRLARRLVERRLPEDHPERIRIRDRALIARLDRLGGFGRGSGRDGSPAGKRLLAEAEEIAASGPIGTEALARLEGARRSTRTAAGSAVADRFRLEPPAVRPPPPPGRRSLPDEAETILARLEDSERSLPGPKVDALERRLRVLLAEFSGDRAARDRVRSAVRGARDRARERKKARIAAFQFAELCDHAKALADSVKAGTSLREATRARKELGRLRGRFRRLELPEDTAVEPLEESLRKAETAIAAAQAAGEDRRRKAKERVVRLETRLAAVLEAETLPLAEAESALRDLGSLRGSRDDWRRAGPTRQARFQRLQAALMPRVREARELREWKRWSNLEEQTGLVAKARRLLEVEDDRKVEVELTRLERSWHRVRHTGPERGQELWDEWTEVREQLLERVGPLRESAERERTTRLEALADLVVRAQEIAEEGDSGRAAEMRGFMVEWRRHAKGLGKQSEKLWKRFHAANDRYFTGLKAARKKRFQELEANVPIREELIRRARALSEGSDAGTVRNSVRALMLEWKEAPPVPRKRSDPLWEAFRTACDQARDRFRGGSRSNGASGADGGPADAPSGLSEDEEAALRARVAELGDLPAAERAAVAEAVWTEYRRLRRVGEPAVTHATSVPRIERELAASLREAFAEAPETFPGTRFNQANLTRKLGALLRSLQKLDRRPRRATTESGVVGLAEQLRRSLQQGSPADPDAEARSAARTAARTFERARALGPALSPAAVKNLNRLERLAKKVIARAPAPPDHRRSSSRRSRGRRSRRNPRLSRFDRRSPAVPAHGAG